MGKGKASKVESYSSALQAQAAAQQAALAQQQYAYWQQHFAPQEKAMMTELSRPVQQQAYFKRAMGDIEKQYGDVAGTTRRTLAGRYQYGSGYEGAAARNLALSKAGTRAQAWGAGEEMRRGGLMTMFGFGRGSAEMGLQGLSAAGQQAGAVAGRLGELRAEKMRQITSATSSGISTAGNICCFIFLEGHGELKENVKQARDEMFPEGGRVSHGYRVMANWIVPLMRENEAFKAIIQDMILDPIAEFSKRYYAGENLYPYKAISFYWAHFWYDLSFCAYAPMTWEDYSQIARC
jgi:hypothetical protein